MIEGETLCFVQISYHGQYHKFVIKLLHLNRDLEIMQNLEY